MKAIGRLLALSVAALMTMPWAAVGAADRATPDGFYGGIAVRDGASEQRVAIRDAAGAFGRFAPSVGELQSSQALVYGGYRWRGAVAVEAALASESYALPGRGGVGLVFPGEDEAASRRWNLDVQGSWALWRSLSLYGRLGYAQSEIAPYYRTAVVASTGEWRAHDGVNYGIGLRYGLTRSLGLRLEYARSGLFGTEPVGATPYDDQVQLGVQFRF